MGQGDPGGQHQTGMTRTRWHAAPGRGKRAKEAVTTASISRFVPVTLPAAKAS
jgi:hypothetical protein